MHELLVPEKKKRNEKFSCTSLRAMIEAANTVYSLSTEYVFDEEAEGHPHENLESALRKIGSECVEYRMNLKLARRGIEASIAFVGGLAVTFIGIFSNNPELFLSGSVALGCGSLAVTALENDREKHDFAKAVSDAIEGKNAIEVDLAALGLDKNYIHRNFRQIIRAFVMMEKEVQEDDEIKEQRKRLGLSEEQLEEKVRQRLTEENSIVTDKTLSLTNERI